MHERLTDLMSYVKRASDFVLPVIVAAVVGAMIVPLPGWAVDAGIALNLAASVSLLVAAIYARHALKVTAFPTLLLITTLFRLSLNVSSTRLALAEGHAGKVIQAFGEFVVRGDYLVGAVIFAILALVQFLVVAKGAERVAEVSARFTLDAMPGKQMSIDADLRAGAIDQAQARKRRRDLERESQMFGAMDGAMKFVKGDVIAGLVIVLVNLVGGLIVGVLENGMSLADAASTYALIAIGDGLVSQLPSLCIAIAAGLVVTRVAAEREEDSLGTQIGNQFFGQPKVLWVVAGLCFLLAMMPGMPRFIFLFLAAALGAGGYLLDRRAAEEAALEVKGAQEAAAASVEAAKAEEPQVNGLGVSPLTLDLSSSLDALVTADGGKKFQADLGRLREQIYQELGIRIPGVRVRTGARYLAESSYGLCIDEIPCATGQVSAGSIYALMPASELSFLGAAAIPVKHPVTGRGITQLPEAARAQLEAAQVQIREPRELICAHLAAVIRRRAATLIGVQEVQGLLEAFEPAAPSLVKEALGKVPLPLLTEVFRKLLQEEVSVRNLKAILEALVSPATEGDAQALADRCRQALHRYLSHKYASSGPLFAHLVDPAVEELLRDQSSHGAALDPDRVGQLLEAVGKVAIGGKAVLLTAPDVRRTLRKLCEGAFPEVAVLTYAELDAELQIRPVGRLAA